MILTPREKPSYAPVPAVADTLTYQSFPCSERSLTCVCAVLGRQQGALVTGHIRSSPRARTWARSPVYPLYIIVPHSAVERVAAMTLSPPQVYSRSTEGLRKRCAQMAVVAVGQLPPGPAPTRMRCRRQADPFARELAR